MQSVFKTPLRAFFKVAKGGFFPRYRWRVFFLWLPTNNAACIF
ncbi:hypothetical protein VP137E351_P0049 [Vibrio phage 137E35-1]|nr:hypothetical protein VP137E351_P0049 [Vibrio phage 137E35-1]CAH9016369.1 hypothetical protein VP230E391_P0049 [Vibrio phage 230E39-1]